MIRFRFRLWLNRIIGRFSGHKAENHEPEHDSGDIIQLKRIIHAIDTSPKLRHHITGASQDLRSECVKILNEKHGIKHFYICSCGREVIVWTNQYGSGCTGMANCECGAKFYIN